MEFNNTALAEGYYSFGMNAAFLYILDNKFKILN